MQTVVLLSGWFSFDGLTASLGKTAGLSNPVLFPDAFDREPDHTVQDAG